MLRFNTEKSGVIVGVKSLFQYILCYGSTVIRFWVWLRILKFQYILCYGSTGYISSSRVWNGISIHPMLRFNQEYGVYYRFQFKFQYILCYGSTVLGLCDVVARLNFNTSYVTVQL